MVMSPVFAGFWPPVITRTKTASSTNTSALTTYTFSAQSLGDATADRLIVVTVSAYCVNAARTLNSASIGGVSATVHVQRRDYQAFVAIISAIVPTGTTGNIDLVFSANMSGCSINVEKLTGYISATPENTGNDGGASATTLSTSNSTSAGAEIFYSVAYNTNATCTPSDADIEYSTRNGPSYGTGTHAVYTNTTGGIHVETMTASAIENSSMCSAAWR